MRERIAKFALAIGTVFLASVVTLYLLTGGFATELLGLHISLYKLTIPLFTTVALVSIWLLLSKDGMTKMIEDIENVSSQIHRKIAYAVGAALAIYVSLLKTRQHFTFQTSAYDLGIQANVAWNTAHGYLFYDSIQHINYLGDHFSPLYLVLAIFYRLWEDAATLLIIQSIGIGLATVPLYLLTLKHLQRKWPAVVITILFLVNPYLHKVSKFDFHPIALAIPIFLWMLYFIESERYVPVVALALLAVTVEETLLPPLVGIGIYIALFHRRFREIGLLIAILATVYFMLALNIWMPFFLGEDRLTHIGRYANLGGNSLGDILYAVLRNPVIFFREMVVPFEKLTSLAALFLSVGFLPLLAPRQFILLMLPVSILLVSNFSPQWHFNYQYSAIILPFLFFCSIHGFHRLHRLLNKWSPAWASRRSTFMVKAVCLTFVLFIGYNLYRSPSYVGRWSKMYVEAIFSLIKEIPPTASVCATQNFVPHLINRHRVSMFGRDRRGDLDLRDGEYLLLELKSLNSWVTWPLSVEEYRQAVADVQRSKAYTVFKERDGVVLLKRKTVGVEDG